MKIKFDRVFFSAKASVKMTGKSSRTRNQGEISFIIPVEAAMVKLFTKGRQKKKVEEKPGPSSKSDEPVQVIMRKTKKKDLKLEVSTQNK